MIDSLTRLHDARADFESGQTPALPAVAGPLMRRVELDRRAARTAADRSISHQQTDRALAFVGMREPQPGREWQCAQHPRWHFGQIERSHPETSGTHDQIDRTDAATHGVVDQPRARKRMRSERTSKFEVRTSKFGGVGWTAPPLSRQSTTRRAPRGHDRDPARPPGPSPDRTDRTDRPARQFRRAPWPPRAS